MDSPTACLDPSISTVTSASIGEYKVSFSGTMASPSPITPSENTPSFTSFRGITFPVRNALNTFSPSSEFSFSFIREAVTPAAALAPAPAAISAISAAVSVFTEVSSASFFLPTINVRTRGTAIAIAIQMAKLAIYCGWMERIPGSPPTPIAFAVVDVATQTTAARAEPIIPQINGNPCFRFTPKIAGSVTPR